jgi:biopolymer transport protein ExbD/biopolymer transport protein TolR
MAFSGAGGGASKAEMNVTPLIDVLLVIIIIFMVAVSLQKEKGVTADIPQPGPEQTTPQPRTIIVQVFETSPGERAVKINEETVTWDALPDRLREIFIRRNERVAFVKGDKDLDFQVVAEVVDIVHHSGADRVGLITKDMQM